MLSQENRLLKTEKPQRNLLLVDDEENITRSLLRLLRQDGYSIYTASSGEEGLSILEEYRIGVILSDQRMPEMSGTEFLSQVSKLYPDTIRIVLSGYTDLETVTDAINEGKIYKFLTKPWDDMLLRQNIEEAFRQYELAEENKRLSLELKNANDELKRANTKLSNNVKTETRNAQINLRSLQVAQDILQHLPIGIIGIDEEKIVVFANDQSHSIFSGIENGLIGNDVSNVLPINIYDYEKDKLFNIPHHIAHGDTKLEVNILFYKYRILNDTDGFIAAIVPRSGVHND